MCCLKGLFKHASMATLSNVFWEFRYLHELLNTLLVQSQNHSKLHILQKQNSKHYCNTLHVVLFYAWVISSGRAVMAPGF